MKDKKSNWIPPIDANYRRIKSDSWFDIRSTTRKKKTDINRVTNDDTKVTATKKFRLFPNPDQADILQKWFDLSRQMYNITTLFIRKHILDKKGVFIEGSDVEFVNFTKLRDTYLKNENIALRLHKINSHILDESIKRCVSMYKGCITKYKKGHLDKICVRKIKEGKRYKTLILDSGQFSTDKNAFCVRALKVMKSDIPFDDHMGTSILSYDKYKSKYILAAPITKETTDFKSRELACGIDPGSRTFLTVYSRKDCHQICNDPDFSKYFKKIDNLNARFNASQKELDDLYAKNKEGKQEIKKLDRKFKADDKKIFNLRIKINTAKNKISIINAKNKANKKKARKKEALSKKEINDQKRIDTLNAKIADDKKKIDILFAESKHDKKEIDNLNSACEAVEKKINDLYIISRAEKKKRRYRKAMARYHDKIVNRVKDMHFKVSKFLCTKFNRIRLGKISTERICSNTKSNISRKTKRIINSLGHSKFRSILEYQCEKYGCELELVNEFKTTMNCSSCGNEKRDVGASKVYHCDDKKCGLVADRDINAAKNIRYKQ